MYLIQKKFLLLFLLLGVFFISNWVEAKPKQPCLFNGTVNEVKVKSFKCEIVHDSGPSYLMISLDFGGYLWMMDLTGVTKKSGQTNFTLVLKKHDGKKFSESYSGSGMQNIFRNPKEPVIFGFFKSAFLLKDSKGKTLSVKGDFLWDTSRFPNR